MPACLCEQWRRAQVPGAHPHPARQFCDNSAHRQLCWLCPCQGRQIRPLTPPVRREYKDVALSVVAPRFLHMAKDRYATVRGRLATFSSRNRLRIHIARFDQNLDASLAPWGPSRYPLEAIVPGSS